MRQAKKQVEFIFEVLFQAFFEAFFDLIFRQVGADWRLIRVCLYSGFGGIAGALSLFLFRNHLIGSDAIRYVAVIVIPILLGWAMRWVGQRRKHRSGDEYGLESFWPSWGFAFSFGLVRLLFAK